MGCTAIQNNTLALELLVDRLQVGGPGSLGSAWEGWFAQALDQLEADDSIEAHLADSIAEALSQTEDALREGRRADGEVQHLIRLVTEARVEKRWREKAQNLRPEQLRSTTFDDLHKALDAASHSPALVEAWIDLTEAELLSLWDGYEAGDVLPSEVTIESMLGHEFLSEGLEEWLTALAELRDCLGGELDRAAILARAEAGQRLLVAVQVIEQERRNLRETFIAAWMN